MIAFSGENPITAGLFFVLLRGFALLLSYMPFGILHPLLSDFFILFGGDGVAVQCFQRFAEGVEEEVCRAVGADILDIVSVVCDEDGFSDVV